ncbi:MAG: hypothetical protein SGPRY_013768, partial [Prymnesium sp.]
VVGLTGGIACGKSTLSQLLREKYELRVIDADAISHDLLSSPSLATRRLIAAFGRQIANPDGSIDRKKLGRVVFGDRAMRKKVERIQNPHIAWAIFLRLLTHFLTGRSVVLIDAPLLFESGLHRVCSCVLAVQVDPQLQLERLMARDRAGEADARSRILAQKMSGEEKARRADVCLPNNQGEAELESSLARVAPSLLHCSLFHTCFNGPSLLLLSAALRLPWSQLSWASLLCGGVGGLAVVCALLAAYPKEPLLAKRVAGYTVLLLALCVLVPSHWVVALVSIRGRSMRTSHPSKPAHPAHSTHPTLRTAYTQPIKNGEHKRSRLSNSPYLMTTRHTPYRHSPQNSNNCFTTHYKRTPYPCHYPQPCEDISSFPPLEASVQQHVYSPEI